MDDFVRKGGKPEQTVGRKCLCNGLMANIGLAQVRREQGPELPLVTCGDEVRSVGQFLPAPDALRYSAHDVLDHLLSKVPVDQPSACVAPQ